MVNGSMLILHNRREKMKKFVVDRVEVMETEEGMKYWGIFDEDNNNWYEEQKNFKENTLKIMYNNVLTPKSWTN